MKMIHENHATGSIYVEFILKINTKEEFNLPDMKLFFRIVRKFKI